MWRPEERIKYEPKKRRPPSQKEIDDALLFKPLKIGRLQLQSRSWVPAMVPWRASNEGFITDNVLGWYERFAKGKPGAIVIEATGIADIASGPLLRISHDRYLPGLKQLTERVKKASEGQTKLLIQLIDFLAIKRRPKPEAFFQKYLTISDDLRTKLQNHCKTDDEIRAYLQTIQPEKQKQYLTKRQWQDLYYGYRESVNDTHLPHIAELPNKLPKLFSQAAKRAEQAGFDGIELHYAHAYTMSSFLSPTNQRTDGYGGDLHGRLRLPLEVFKAVRQAVSNEMIVGCRYLSDEIIEDGGRVDDAIDYALAFARAGMDFLSLSRGGKFDDAAKPKVGQAAYPYTGRSGYECMPQYISDQQGPFGRNIKPTAAIKQALLKKGFETPVVLAGGIYDFQGAETCLKTGQADIIASARQSLADPDWFLKTRLGCAHEIRLCRFTNYCEALDQKHKEVTCELWDREGLDTPDICLTKDKKRRLTPPLWQQPKISKKSKS